MPLTNIRVGTTGKHRFPLKNDIHRYLLGKGCASPRKGSYTSPSDNVDDVVELLSGIYTIEKGYPDTRIGAATITSSTLITVILRRTNFGYITKS